MDNYNLIHCIKGNVTDNLNDLLEQLDEEYLESIYYYLIKKEIKMNKKVLIKKISKQLLIKETIEKIISVLINDEYQVLLKIINNNGIIQDNEIILGNCVLLQNKGILYLINENEKAYLIVPKEIIEIIKNLDLDNMQNEIQKNTRLNDLAYSMVNLYGIVKVDDYIKACFKYYNYDNVMEINILSVLEQSRFNPIVIFDVNDINYLSKDEFMESGYYELLQSKIYESKNHFIDKKEISILELLKYKDLSYYESNN